MSSGLAIVRVILWAILGSWMVLQTALNTRKTAATSGSLEWQCPRAHSVTRAIPTFCRQRQDPVPAHIRHRCGHLHPASAFFLVGKRKPRRSAHDSPVRGPLPRLHRPRVHCDLHRLLADGGPGGRAAPGAAPGHLGRVCDHPQLSGGQGPPPGHPGPWRGAAYQVRGTSSQADGSPGPRAVLACSVIINLVLGDRPSSDLVSQPGSAGELRLLVQLRRASSTLDDQPCSAQHIG